MPVNGVDLYYEVHGDGPPRDAPWRRHPGRDVRRAVGGNGKDAPSHRTACSGSWLEQGHDTSQPWSHEAFADDVAALLGRLGIKKASVMRYSSGGAVALQTAIRHPDLVDKVVIISTPISLGRLLPGGPAGVRRDACGGAEARGEREQLAARRPLSVCELGDHVQEDG
jgi:pimeloyl-ACP methyl ester carboxylesterase